MEHIPTIEGDVEKVYRIARELDISLEDAAVTGAGFELAFGDDGMRRAIFEIVDQLDESAAKKGEPMGLIINYTVELGIDGIRVGRYADEIPPGQVVSLTPTDRAMIFLKIKDNFPTQQFLGPLIVNRPGWHFDTFDPNAEIPEDLLYPEPPRQPICLGPIRLKFNERFPRHSAAVSQSQRGSVLRSADSTALKPRHHVSPMAALPAGMPAFQSSGLSPPLNSENIDTPIRKMSLGPWQK